MRKIALFLAFSIFLIAIVGCTGKRLGEEEYISIAKEAISKGNIEDAIFAYKNAVKYYPESPKIAEYKEKLSSLILEAMFKFSDSRKGEIYKTEYFAMNKNISDTVKKWIEFKMNLVLEGKEPERAESEFKKFSPRDFDMVAQYSLMKEDYKTAVSSYEKWATLYPDYKPLFLAGFGYSEYFSDYPKAREFFQKVIDDYPDCDLAPSALWMIENMGKPADQIQFLDESKAAKK